MSLPEIVSHEEWVAARVELLAREKELTRARDELAAARRRLPMAPVDTDYRFEGPDGELRPRSTCSRAATSSSSAISCSTPGGRTAAPAAPRAPTRWRRGQDRPPAHPRHHPGLRVPRTVCQDRRLQAAAGLDVSVVLVTRLGLQLRLPRHARRVRGAGAVQLPHPGGVRAGRPAFRAGRRVPRALSFLRDGDRVTTPTRSTPAGWRRSAARTTCSRRRHWAGRRIGSGPPAVPPRCAAPRRTSPGRSGSDGALTVSGGGVRRAGAGHSTRYSGSPPMAWDRLLAVVARWSCSAYAARSGS